MPVTSEETIDKAAAATTATDAQDQDHEQEPTLANEAALFSLISNGIAANSDIPLKWSHDMMVSLIQFKKLEESAKTDGTEEYLTLKKNILSLLVQAYLLKKMPSLETAATIYVIFQQNKDLVDSIEQDLRKQQLPQ